MVDERVAEVELHADRGDALEQVVEVLDLNTGELVDAGRHDRRETGLELRTTDVGEDNAAVYVERRPQGGGTVEGEWVETSALTRAALERWLDVREDLVQRAHGTSKLWVSLWINHDGVFDDDGHTTIRPPGMPLEENGVVTSYRVGRLRHDGLRQLLPLKLEQLQRAVDAEHQRTAA
ncbi:hypothetical protein [Streptomyces venezuelae]|uniref:hypothetical protein n=1 Tax=Streptomyces venezuelae TaxID=54571 RepID=UPI001F2B67BE|nr:hypothetical protein [Streptomyces venezuelae]